MEKKKKRKKKKIINVKILTKTDGSKVNMSMYCLYLSVHSTGVHTRECSH